MVHRNAKLLAKGYAPTMDVAQLMEKDRATVKRMVDRGLLRAVKDGPKMRYIDLESLEQYYRSDKNTAMAQAVRAFRTKIVAEGLHAGSAT